MALVFGLGLGISCGPATPAETSIPTESAQSRPVAGDAGESAAADDGPVTVPGFKAIDVYGTSQVTARAVVDQHRALFEELGQLHGAGPGDADSARRFGEVMVGLIQGIGAMGSFAHVDLGIISFYPPERGTYLTVDIVEEVDRERRIVFDASPVGDITDPEGLLAAWSEYMSRSFALLRKGEVDQKGPCPVFHCTFGFTHPELAPFEKRFTDGAARHKEVLIRALREDKEPEKRANAAFALAHLPDGDEVVRLMLPAIRDPSSRVRNNAMRVTAMIATNHPDIAVPIAPFIEALNYPATSDRNKAAATLKYLAKNPETHPVLVREAGDVLLALLRLHQPANHDDAYEILKMISGKEYGARDYSAWRTWLNQARSGARK